jgi:hypothetical protein
MKQIALYRLTVALLTVGLLPAFVSLWDARKSLAEEKTLRATEAMTLIE